MKKRMGFTIGELLVVIAILVVLALILYPVYARVRDKAEANEVSASEEQRIIAESDGAIIIDRPIDELEAVLSYNTKVYITKLGENNFWITGPGRGGDQSYLLAKGIYVLNEKYSDKQIIRVTAINREPGGTCALFVITENK